MKPAGVQAAATHRGFVPPSLPADAAKGGRGLGTCVGLPMGPTEGHPRHQQSCAPRGQRKPTLEHGVNHDGTTDACRISPRVKLEPGGVLPAPAQPHTRPRDSARPRPAPALGSGHAEAATPFAWSARRPLGRPPPPFQDVD